MSVSQIILLVYGILLVVGAFLGFKAGSRVSLVMGLVSGLLIFAGVYLVSACPKIGYLFSALISGALIIIFAKRFLKTRKLMPGGLLGIISLAVFLLCVIQVLKSQ